MSGCETSKIWHLIVLKPIETIHLIHHKYSAKLHMSKVKQTKRNCIMSCVCNTFQYTGRFWFSIYTPKRYHSLGSHLSKRLSNSLNACLIVKRFISSRHTCRRLICSWLNSRLVHTLTCHVNELSKSCQTHWTHIRCFYAIQNRQLLLSITSVAQNRNKTTVISK